MKRNMSPKQAFLTVALFVLVVVVAGILYLNSGGHRRTGDDQWFEMEADMKKAGVDLRKLPQYAAAYYVHHPEETPPAELKAEVDRLKDQKAAPSAEVTRGAPPQ